MNFPSAVETIKYVEAFGIAFVALGVYQVLDSLARVWSAKGQMLEAQAERYELVTEDMEDEREEVQEDERKLQELLARQKELQEYHGLLLTDLDIALESLEKRLEKDDASEPIPTSPDGSGQSSPADQEPLPVGSDAVQSTEESASGSLQNGN